MNEPLRSSAPSIPPASFHSIENVGEPRPARKTADVSENPLGEGKEGSIPFRRRSCHVAAMPNHKVGSSHGFAQLLAAYNADPQAESAPHYLLYKGDEILALCLRYKYNPEPGEVWIGNDPVTAEWGKKLAALKDKKVLPLYYAPRSRTFYEFKGYFLITGDTDDAKELMKRKGPVPISRVVFIHPMQTGAR
jgi:hypothetical protein